jgi:hypothetical protein
MTASIAQTQTWPRQLRNYLHIDCTDMTAPIAQPSSHRLRLRVYPHDLLMESKSMTALVPPRHPISYFHFQLTILFSPSQCIIIIHTGINYSRCA